MITISTQQENLDWCIAYFHLLKKCLHNAPRAAVLEHLRPLFKIFLEAFGYSSEKDENVNTQSLFFHIVLIFPRRNLISYLHLWS
jgi:hypothetical protein